MAIISHNIQPFKKGYYSITNPYDEPVHLLAFLVTNEAKVFYPDHSMLPPVVWEDEA